MLIFRVYLSYLLWLCFFFFVLFLLNYYQHTAGNLSPWAGVSQDEVEQSKKAQRRPLSMEEVLEQQIVEAVESEAVSVRFDNLYVFQKE